jgi:hypothetical protein
MAGDLFGEINNAVLDLQAAEHAAAERPLRKLALLLEHRDLGAANDTLTRGLDLDSFLAANPRSHGIPGGDKLDWPDDPVADLGVRLLLVRRLCGDPRFLLEFSRTYHHAGRNNITAHMHNMVRQLIIPFARDYKAYVLNHGEVDPLLMRPVSRRIFIVHGHDGEARETVARFLSDLGLEPVILHEQANRGRTVIEKVEANDDVSFAVVLLTPDDLGRARGEVDLEPRARQNVLLELGYFMAKLGRDRVCALRRGEVSIPSDFAGVVWEDMDLRGGWKLSLARELKAAGQDIDLNRVMSC